RKQGKLTAVLRQLGSCTPEERKRIGQEANAVKEAIEERIGKRQQELDEVRFANLGEEEWMDVTAPGIRTPVGSVHPISRAIEEIAVIFERIGFIRVRHPEVESDYYAFEGLNMPPDHPARDEWETFFIKDATGNNQRQETKNKKQGTRTVLTPHTSNGQVREMEKGILPIRMVNIGKCYRRQMDVTHTPMFNQFEGFLVDRDVSVTHLKGTLDYFVQSYFGPDRRTRLRPFHFMFTEPSFEIDISCAVCGGMGKHENGDRCRLCKGGWLELGGAGMVHPNVLRAGNVDPKEYGGFAFGWGVERVLMMKYGIDDIRLLYGNDLRFLAQEHV
ncbi:MAG: phenylalanine--tRNA ligase subunit alpha, partial [Candidatus Uhrbacteria bacterium]